MKTTNQNRIYRLANTIANASRESRKESQTEQAAWLIVRQYFENSDGKKNQRAALAALKVIKGILRKQSERIRMAQTLLKRVRGKK